MPSYLKKLIAINIVILLLIVLGWVGFSWLESSPLPDNFGFLSSNIDEESSSGSTGLTATSAPTTAFLSAEVDWETRTVDPDSINWQQLQDPFTAEPSFYSGRNTFQPLLKLTTTQETGQGYAVYTFSQQQIDGEQQPEHLQSYAWLMYGQSNELTRLVIGQFGMKGYQQLVDQLLAGSWAQRLNPAVTWLFFNRLAQVNPNIFQDGLPVAKVITHWNVARNDYERLSANELNSNELSSNDLSSNELVANELVSTIKGLGWTSAGQQMLYFSVQNFDQETVEQLFADSGWMSYAYQNQFIQPLISLKHKFSLQGEDLPVSELEAFYGGEDASGTSRKAMSLLANSERKSAICRLDQAYFCQMLSLDQMSSDQAGDLTWWQCQRASILDDACQANWLPEIEML